MSPDIDRLIEIAHMLADRMNLPKPDPDYVRGKVNELLYERDHLECLEQGITTIDEVALLLLGHFHTLICNSANTVQSSATYEFHDLQKAIEHAILRAGA